MRPNRLIVKFISIAAILFVFYYCGSNAPNSDEPRHSFASNKEASLWYQSRSGLDWMYPNSQAILKAAFHKRDKVLILFFKSNASNGYIYGNVPEHIWDAFQNAESKGNFYTRNIKGRYQFKLK